MFLIILIIVYYHYGLLNQIAGSTNNLVKPFKQMRASVRGKISSRRRPRELDEERSWLEINCSLSHTEVKVTDYFDLAEVCTWFSSK